MQFSYGVDLSFILFRWCPQQSQYWLRWKTCSKSLLGIPLFSSSFHSWVGQVLILGFLRFMELFCSLLPGHSELYHYHLLWIHGPYKYIWSEVWTCYFLKEMLCAFLGLPSFASSWDGIIWHSVCTTGRWDLLKASIVSDLSKGQQVVYGSEKKTQLKWLIFPQHLSG